MNWTEVIGTILSGIILIVVTGISQGIYLLFKSHIQTQERLSKLSAWQESHDEADKDRFEKLDLDLKRIEDKL